MIRPMIPLTFNAAIFHEFASRAHLEFDDVPSRNATRGAHLIGLLYVAAHYYAKDVSYTQTEAGFSFLRTV